MNIYLSPSTQEKNFGVGEYGTEENRMNQLADKVEVHLKRNRLNFFRNKKSFTPSQSATDSNAQIGSKGLHIALHTNSGGGTGCEIFHHAKSNEGKKLAQHIYKYIEELTPSNDRGVKPNSTFTELIKTQSIAILIEVDFHDNKNGVAFILSKMDEVAQAIVKGICNYLNREYIEVTTAAKPPIQSKQTYRVITGSFTDKNNALKRQDELEKQGFDSFIEVKKV